VDVYWDSFYQDLSLAVFLQGLLPNSPERPDGVHIFETPIQKCNVILGARMPLE
jgi:hypothetical protein